MTEPYRPPERLRTERLALRASTVADAPAILAAYATDPLVARYTGWRPHRSVDETVAYLERCDAKRAAGTDFAFVIEERTNGEGHSNAGEATVERKAAAALIGMIEAHVARHAVGFGYVLRRGRWGKGFAAEALAALVAHALAHPSIFRAHAVCDVDNPASARVMEKAGMVREGVLRCYLVHPNVSHEPRDCLVYAKVR